MTGKIGEKLFMKAEKNTKKMVEMIHPRQPVFLKKKSRNPTSKISLDIYLHKN